MLTRKDFKEQARLISLIEDEETKTKEAIRYAIIAKRSNDRFDMYKFSLACGLVINENNFHLFAGNLIAFNRYEKKAK